MMDKSHVHWHQTTISVTLYRAHSLVPVLPSFVHVLSIHRLTPTHEAAETMLQKFSLALCHLLKDDLVVVVSVLLDTGSNSLQTLTASRAVPMLATLLQPEFLHGSRDLLLNVLVRPGLIAGNHLVCDEEGTCESWLLAIPTRVKRQEQLHQSFIAC